MTDESTDVAVVGGGLSGLAAARRCHRDGADVRVFEARDAVGGKIETRTVGGVRVELGAGWIGPEQDRMDQLADEFGVRRLDQHAAGEALCRVDGHRGTDERVFRALPDAAHAELVAAVDVLDARASADPTPESNARSVGEWADAHLDHPAARAAFESLVRAVFCADGHEVSLAFVDAFGDAVGGLSETTSVGGHASALTTALDGVAAIPEGIAAELGDRVRTDEPVHRIEYDDDGATVHTAERTCRARRAVVALPPAMASRVAYDPPLPPARDELGQRLPNGSVVKFVVVYDRPFWREAGLSGQVVDADGPVDSWFDATRDAATAGVLFGLTGGSNARRLAARSPTARREVVVDALVDLFGESAAAPRAYDDVAWGAEPWVRGAYAAYAPPGAMANWGRRTDPVGPLHWAASETAGAWYGHMEGAVRAGERAAAEVLAALGG
jgi:monoamine oxidase